MKMHMYLVVVKMIAKVGEHEQTRTLEIRDKATAPEAKQEALHEAQETYGKTHKGFKVISCQRDR